MMKDGMFWKGLVCAIIILFIGTSFVSAFNVNLVNKSKSMNRGNWLYVGGSGPENYSSIQAAINAASNGDTVFVYDDSSPYYEHVIIDKSINLIGENKNTTVIYCITYDTVIYIIADNINIKGFKIQNGDMFGIFLYFSDHTTIKDNYITNNGCAIYLQKSRYNIIMENIIASNIPSWGGIVVDDHSNFNNITNNAISGKEIAICTSNSNNIFDNSFFNAGLIVYDSYHNNVVNNTVNSKPLVYFEQESDIVISDDAGQVILVSCKNITVKNQNLSDTEVGLELLGTINCKIIENDCFNNYYGIYLDNSENNTFIGNNVSLNNFIGIGLYDSSSNILIDNTFLYNDYSIYLLSSIKNNIIRNNISKNKRDGIHIDSGSNNNKITDNIISDNDECGIWLYHSSNNNTIYHNKFIKNSQNAYDVCSNIWDDGYLSGGNFWSDYDGTDSDGDGIGDTPYPIPGGDNKDRYPLGNFLPDAPIINGPTNGKTGVEYKYNFSLSDPDNDAMYLRVDWGNGTPSPWQGPYDSDTTVKLSHIWNQKGTYAIRAQAKDIYGAESEWGTLKVTMPMNQQSSQQSLINQNLLSCLLLQQMVKTSK